MGFQNYRAVVEYDGTNYYGFQIQPNRPTIQGELERALLGIGRSSPVRVHGAGRTDAGVHARGQVINFLTEWPHSVSDLERALNAVLPDDIRVRQVSVAAPNFHARFSARARTYRYIVYCGQVRSPLLDRFTWYVPVLPPVDRLDAMAQTLVGEHDFAAFGQAPWGSNTVRMIYAANWRQVAFPAWAGDAENGALMLRFEITANAFLRGMVRRIVSTILGQSACECPVSEMATILQTRDLSRASSPAPARGLYLWNVAY